MADRRRGRREAAPETAGNTPARTAGASRHRGWRIAVIAAAVLAALYLIACILAGVTQTVFPRTSVAGVNLGGMTREQVLAQDFGLSGKTIELNCGSGGSVTFDGDLLLSDSAVTAVADEAMDVGRTGNFFTNGAAYFKCLIAGTKLETAVLSTEENSTQVKAVLDQASALTCGTAEGNAWTVNGENLEITRGGMTYTVDEDALLAKITAAFARRDYSAITVERTEAGAPEVDIQAVYDAVCKDAANATLDENYNVKAEVVGVSFDKDKAQSLLSAAKPGETVEVPLTFTQPEITASELSQVLFRDKLSSCTTTVSGSSSRVSNVKTAAGYCSGTILRAGETFSYNGTVGARTTERGFLEAPAYNEGQTVEEVGGGVCQVSSTIYLAALRADLTIVERHNHSYVCSYMPTGQDATVSWGSLDLQFQNNTKYPIKVVAYLQGKTLTVEVYGTKTAESTYAEMTAEVTSTTDYQTVEKEDPSLPAGTRTVSVTGYNGQTCKVYRNRYDASGNLIETVLESENKYKVRNKIILVGTGTTAGSSDASDASGTSSASDAAPTTSASASQGG